MSILLNNHSLINPIGQKLFKFFLQEFIFNSNSIEGSQIPHSSLKELIDTGNTKYTNSNEIQEIKNSLASYNYMKNDFKFNINSIKRLYHILTNKLYISQNQLYPKGFKKMNILVNNANTTPPEKVKEELNQLCKWYQNNKTKLHPFILAFLFHLHYEKNTSFSR